MMLQKAQMKLNLRLIHLNMYHLRRANQTGVLHETMILKTKNRPLLSHVSRQWKTCNTLRNSLTWGSNAMHIRSNIKIKSLPWPEKILIVRELVCRSTKVLNSKFKSKRWMPSWLKEKKKWSNINQEFASSMQMTRQKLNLRFLPFLTA